MLRTVLRLSLTGVLLSSLAANAQARELDTAFGEVDVPDAPERIVTLYEGALDASVAAGVTPIGAIATRGGNEVATYIGEHIDTSLLEMVGVARETNIEAILRLEPDLILAAPQLPEEQYRLLSRIAPTVVPNTTGFSQEGWKDESRLFGKALGKEAEIVEALEAVEQRAAELNERLSEADVGGTAYIVRWMPAGPMVMSSELFSTGVLASTGLTVDDEGLVKEGSAHSDILSLENLSLIDGDWLFLATLNEEGQQALDAAEQSSAFTRLNVVQQGHVVPVNGQVWSSASGPLAAQAILDDIEEALLP
ncbi:ABC transporter substrate-binding protein [Vreelandella populi]|uniref:Iron-siderophore ABC transporter substrate-binding protein n=1 Tax=Vreelandella populi TaxID=2498858 RepID=A0A3S0WPY0_9GAMM|nr:iron-siderophore ABC transporter substrate-binding protein [Halomonas populi]RUR37862.1 iron-siderophore ABC transporter substrate-binding protein [Halomonas populi]RUR48771.1 iron-siderophore ABC transporter substrate-binding protein [Halomonas populi]